MNIKMPSYFGWLLIALVSFLLLQTACTPIQPISAVATAAPQAMPEEGTPDQAAPDETTLEVVANSTSFDGNWSATAQVAFLEGQDEYYQRLTVLSADNSVRYTIVDRWSPHGLGYTVAVPLTWSMQSDFLYYTNRPTPDGCAPFANGSDLWRVDLANGGTIQLLPAVARVIALSADEQQVAYIPPGGSEIIIHDLASGDEQVFAMPAAGNTQMGSLAWSPDGTQVAVAIAHNPCIGGWAESTSLLIVDAANNEVASILEQDERLLIPLGWTDTDTLIVATLGDPDSARNTLDLDTGALNPIRR